MSILDLIGIAYLVTAIVMSGVCFFIYGYDKRKARSNGYRIPESTLHLLALFGGWPGALIARRYFHHKTQKLLFGLTTVAIIGVHFALIGTWIWLKTRHS